MWTLNSSPPPFFFFFLFCEHFLLYSEWTACLSRKQCVILLDKSYVLPWAVGKARNCPCRVSEQWSLQEIYKETLQHCRCPARAVCCTDIYFSCNPHHCITVLMSILNLWFKLSGTIRTGSWKYRFVNVEHFYLGPSWYCWMSTQAVESAVDQLWHSLLQAGKKTSEEFWVASSFQPRWLHF